MKKGQSSHSDNLDDERQSVDCPPSEDLPSEQNNSASPDGDEHQDGSDPVTFPGLAALSGSGTDLLLLLALDEEQLLSTSSFGPVANRTLEIHEQSLTHRQLFCTVVILSLVLVKIVQAMRSVRRDESCCIDNVVNALLNLETKKWLVAEGGADLASERPVATPSFVQMPRWMETHLREAVQSGAECGENLPSLSGTPSKHAEKTQCGQADAVNAGRELCQDQEVVLDTAVWDDVCCSNSANIAAGPAEGLQSVQGDCPPGNGKCSCFEPLTIRTLGYCHDEVPTAEHEPHRQSDEVDGEDEDGEEENTALDLASAASRTSSPVFVSADRPPPKHPKHADHEERRRTFDYKWLYGGLLNADAMADAGFFYTGEGDRVTCFHCGGRIEKWEPEDNPYSEHRRLFPQCQYVGDKLAEVERRRQRTDGAFVTAFSASSAHPKYADIEDRRQSFGKNWPHDWLPNAYAMAGAGFFYTGKDDRVTCFHCGVSLETWEPDDDPYEQHFEWCPQCEYNGGKGVEARRHRRQTNGASVTASATSARHPWYAQIGRRRATFNHTGWRGSGILDPDAMADAGFFYDGDYGRVTCFHCGSHFDQWEPGDDPLGKHRGLYPGCEYVQRRGGSEASRARAGDNGTSHRPFEVGTPSPRRAGASGFNGARPPPVHGEFASREARWKSFESYPSSAKGDTAKMAAAGFFYTGKKDCVACFQCGKSICSWKDTDDPLEEHRLWYPKCPLLKKTARQG